MLGSDVEDGYMGDLEGKEHVHFQELKPTDCVDKGHYRNSNKINSVEP